MPVNASQFYDQSHHWNDDYDAVALYFGVMGVNLAGIQKLIFLKCGARIHQDSILQRLERLENLYHLKGDNQEWKVGRYLRMVMPDYEKFERLIRFGDREERQATLDISPDSIFVPFSCPLIFI